MHFTNIPQSPTHSQVFPPSLVSLIQDSEWPGVPGGPQPVQIRSKSLRCGNQSINCVLLMTRGQQEHTKKDGPDSVSWIQTVTVTEPHRTEGTFAGGFRWLSNGYSGTWNPEVFFSFKVVFIWYFGSDTNQKTCWLTQFSILIREHFKFNGIFCSYKTIKTSSCQFLTGLVCWCFHSSEELHNNCLTWSTQELDLI